MKGVFVARPWPCMLAAAAMLSACAEAMYREEMGMALDYFIGQADASFPKVKALSDALKTGDLDASTTAYVASRNEYEQIEVLAPGFSTLDCNIDCRPIAYENGEARSNAPGITDSEFQGFHRIENLIYRDMNTSAAVPYGEKLVSDWKALQQALRTPERFEFCSWWEGVIGLATEVGAKKMSSEEETYSDQSVLIYVNNFIGIKEATEPFLARLDGSPMIQAAVMDAYETAMQSVAPFILMAEGFTLYSMVGVAGRDAIQSAAYGLAAALIDARDALLKLEGKMCEAEEEEEEACEALDPEPFLEQLEAGAAYFKAQYPFALARVQAFVDGILASEPLETLKELYVKSRPYYEQFEVLAPAFPDIDAALDARPDGFDGGETNMEFRGFHRLERMIYRDGLSSADDVDKYTGTKMSVWANGLLEDFLALGDALHALPSVPASDVFDGVIGVWTEVVAKKISSEEESWADESILIFINNYIGGYSQIAPFAEGESLRELDEALNQAMRCLDDAVMDPDALSGCTAVTADAVTAACEEEFVNVKFTPYSQVPIETKECIVREGYRLRDAAIQIAKDSGIANTCNNFHKNAIFEYRHVGFLEVIEEFDSSVQDGLVASGEVEAFGLYGEH